MVWFGVTRFLTSHIRWGFSSMVGLVTGRWFAITPPTLATQYICSFRAGKLIRLQIGSYYDWATIHEIFIRGEYDTSTFSVNDQILSHYREIRQRDKALILDLGANVGIAANYFSASYTDAVVVAVEPASANIEALRTNTRRLSNVRVTHAAVAAVSGAVSLFDPGQGNNAYRTFGGDSERLETVASLSISDLLKENQDEIPFLLKVDIEGAEKGLFSKATDWIDEFKVIVVETHDWMLPGQAVSSNLLKALGGKNRDLLFRGENLFSIRNDE